MRIALTHPWSWPTVQRGGERLFADLARALADRGHDVLSVSTHPGGGRHWSAAGVEEVRFRAIRARGLRRLDVDEAVTYLPSAAWAVHRWDPDVVHGMFHLDGLAARMARARHAVVHIQGMPRREVLERRHVHRRLVSPSLRSADVVVAVSNAAAGALHDVLGVKARVLYNGVHTAPFAAAASDRPSGPPSILFPSSVEDPRKRLGLLIDAMGMIAPRWPGLSLSIAAATPAAARASIEAVAKVPVSWLSVRAPEAMPAAYASVWVACCPAVQEAFGLVFVEALASGRPVVGVSDGGVPEVVAEPRWLAEPDDPESLAAVLDVALSDSQSPDIAARCQAMAAAFDWQQRIGAFEALYRELIDGG